MKRRLKILNFGPIKEADIELKGINLIIGPQSSGKSCVLKVASCCSWIEKRIQLTQDVERFQYPYAFWNSLIEFHGLAGYMRDDSYIEYESSYMKFSYSHKERKFLHAWKSHRWDYKRTKIAYIPAERNLLSLISKWQHVKLPQDFLDFAFDWNAARKLFPTKKYILNQQISYRYDEISQRDILVQNGGLEFDLEHASSGFQSLVPLFIYLNYLSEGQYSESRELSFSQKKEQAHLKEILFQREQDKKELAIRTTISNLDANNLVINDVTNARILRDGNDTYLVDQVDKYEGYAEKTYNQFINTSGSDIFLEEPETNLFPPTQRVLVDYLVQMVSAKEKNTVLVTTHSPYVMTRLLEKNLKDFNLFLVNKGIDGLTTVKTASPEEVQEIYDYDVDVFFNIEAYNE